VLVERLFSLTRDKLMKNFQRFLLGRTQNSAKQGMLEATEAWAKLFAQ